MIYIFGELTMPKGVYEHKKRLPIKQCLVCESDFRPKSYLATIGKGKYCSKKCSDSVTLFKTGKQHRLLGDKHPLWKGQNASYMTLHAWVRLHKGRPSKCEHCGTAKAKRFEWANISGEYLRQLDDWVRLCKPCHLAYDNQPEKAVRTKYKKYAKDVFREMGHKGGTQKSINFKLGVKNG